MRQIFTLALALSLGILNAQTVFDYFSRPGLQLSSIIGNQNTSVRFIEKTQCGTNWILVFDYINDAGISDQNCLYINGDEVWLYNPFACAKVTLLYNFGLQVGNLWHNYKVEETGMFNLLNGEQRRYLKLKHLTNGDTIEWVEGIGNLRNTLFYHPMFAGSPADFKLVCIKDDTGELFLNPDSAVAAKCDSLLCPRPFADFGYQYITDNQVHFKNESADGTTFFWNFGDGDTSTETQPNHYYSAPGCYRAELVVLGPCVPFTDTARQTVSVCIDSSWVAISTNHFINDMTFTAPDNGWGIAGGALYWTSTGGTQWEVMQVLTPLFSEDERTFTDIFMLDKNRGIAAAFSEDTFLTIYPTILRTEDGWLTATAYTPSLDYFVQVGMDSSNHAFALNLGGDVLFFSNDGGVNWLKKPLPQAHSLLAFQIMADSVLYAFGKNSQGTFFARSYDLGDQWEIIPLNSEPLQYNFVFTSKTVGWATGGPGYLLHTQDEGNTWTKVYHNEPVGIGRIAFSDSNNGWATGKKGLILHTQDGGLTWVKEYCAGSTWYYGLVAVTPDFALLEDADGRLLKYSPDPNYMCTVGTYTPPAPKQGHLSITPNPANGFVSIHFPPSPNQPNQGTLRLLTATGILVTGFNYTHHDELRLDLSQVPSGMYFLVDDAGNWGKLIVE